ncbi:7,8-dihydro-6-hydroxymethylpterin-pyrophosphokinase (HPPK) [Agrilactobacillus composti DSM 18527 = JCM 14202]|uniref:2-amino-4-hydroxy-6-hydroxymethyldihydropteridine diphosphokinase n=1 Tax=Agrilactobacillus composti DSM 18527 = JCM 14202 TaxID=1423734 RepID=X0PTQ8_9LACO|nr:2-amino-4-hydroxy-6-hydroxymethyldihydropteridine diphosphokinase [Agrilactobacillus composti]KRM36311.1 7,8-dihydro-6-hydroxymethylpterin-pyrophosphokinase (HPPK) [Agrilactobacillus composti DSM 18527 = JCM 14202]GAF41432.1 2-amino-4-hydroxy-6-hydroxymethyldihydropteridine pyrophosphokinase [Agrilactobacillus composti DSM 18527 = JCM 14202]
MHTAYLSIGANMGNKLANLQQAIAELQQNDQINILKVSKYYQTAPVGGVVQDDFLNGALKLETSLTPQALLAVIHSIEKAGHRVRKVHWGPRTIDLDIIFFDQQTIATQSLTIPHPEAFNRRFVLVPLLDVLAEDEPYYDQVTQALAALGESQRLEEFNGV